MTEWISIEDRVPAQDKTVIVRVLEGLDCKKDSDPFSNFIALDSLKYDVDHQMLLFGCEKKWGCLVTHWYDLPELPKVKYHKIPKEITEEKLVSREFIKTPSGEYKINPVFTRKKKFYEYLNSLENKNHKWISTKDIVPSQDGNYLLLEEMGEGAWWSSSISYKEWIEKNSNSLKYNRNFYWMKFPDCLINAHKFTEKLPPPNTWIVCIVNFLYEEENFSCLTLNTGKRSFENRGCWPFQDDFFSGWFECPVHSKIDKNYFTLI